VCVFFEPRKQQGALPIVRFSKPPKTITVQNKRKTLQLSLSEARTRRKTKNHYTHESTQERNRLLVFRNRKV
jgi:hypothetical protein